MVKKLIQRIFVNPSNRIYVVIGEQYQEFKEPQYSTDPAEYHFDLFEYQTESPTTFRSLKLDSPSDIPFERPAIIMKVLQIADDAIDFAYCCNLDTVNLTAYDRINGGWQPSDNQSALDIDW